jgi:hypothetical protein
MKIIGLTEDYFESWEKFCLESDDAWYWHTVKWSKYCAAYRGSIYETRDLSFMVMDDSGIVAVCPLFIEKREGPDGKIQNEILAAGSVRFMIAPALRNDLSDDRREKIHRTIFEHIDFLAKSNQVVRATLYITPLAPRLYAFNWLTKYGYLDSTITTQIIDLSIPKDRLWSSLRKGHKYDVNRGEKNYQIHFYDKTNADKNIFDQYRLFHHKAAGRITRPIETFEMMYEWILSGHGMLCGASLNDRFAGFSYIMLYKDGAFYGSASDDPDFETDIPISHVIQWRVIQWLKEQGYKKYEIGFSTYSAQIHDVPSPKEMSISLFKRGFGGNTVPNFRGIKYYDKDFMEADLRMKLNNLLTHYKE